MVDWFADEELHLRTCEIKSQSGEVFALWCVVAPEVHVASMPGSELIYPTLLLSKSFPKHSPLSETTVFSFIPHTTCFVLQWQQLRA